MVVPGLSWSPGSAKDHWEGAQTRAHGEHFVSDSHRAEAFTQDWAALIGTHLHLTPISQEKCSQPLKKEELGSYVEKLNFPQEQWKNQLNGLQTATRKKETSNKQCGLPRTKLDAVCGVRKALGQRSSCRHALCLQQLPCFFFS